MNQVDCSKMISAVDVDNRNELDLSEVSFLFHVVHLKMVHGLEMDDVVYKVEVSEDTRGHLQPLKCFFNASQCVKQIRRCL